MSPDLARLGIHGRRPGRRLSGVDLPRQHSAAGVARDPHRSFAGVLSCKHQSHNFVASP
jgi:hypothetical protein